MLSLKLKIRFFLKKGLSLKKAELDRLAKSFHSVLYFSPKSIKI